MFLYDPQGRRHKASHLAWVDRVLRLKKKSGSNPWPVIEEVLNFWSSQFPQRYQSFLIDVSNTRATRKDKKYGSSEDKVSGGILRYTLDIPQEVIQILRCIYSADELPMGGKEGKEFFIEFAKRFPRLKIAEKL